MLAPRQGLLKGRDRLYAARAFFEALQLQKDNKVRPCAGLGAASHAQSVAFIDSVNGHDELSLLPVMCLLAAETICVCTAGISGVA